MDSLRKPFFVLALALIAIAVLIEIGGGLVLNEVQPRPSVAQIQSQLPSDPEVQDAFDPTDPKLFQLSGEKPPGLAIPYMALVDGILLFTLALMGISLIVPLSVVGRLQGCASCIFTLLLILAAIVMVFTALGLVILMISLFLAVPFGTIAYFAIYGFFNRGGASAVLSLLMLLKLGSAASLFFAQQRFLQQTGLVLLILTSLLCNIIIGFLHGLVPGFLVSITDGVGAIIVAILAIIWLLFLGIGAIIAIIKALQPS
jgi:hypothetical protein